MEDEANATKIISRIEEINHPTMVIGWAMANDNRRAILRSNDMFAMIAKASDTELMAMSLMSSMLAGG